MATKRIALTVPFDINSYAAQLPLDEAVGNVYARSAGASLDSAPAGNVLSACVKALKAGGVSFTYCMDETCLDNLEWTRQGQKKIRGLLDTLAASGVDAVAVSMPFLAELIKKEYRGLGVEVALNAEVDNIQRARRWEDAGADLITLASYRLNRNFDLLKKIRGMIKCGLGLAANHCCLNNCVNHGIHANFASHAGSAFFYSLRCLEPGSRSGFELVSSQWIRPEDIGYYEEIGMNRLQLYADVSDQKNTREIISAYSRRSYKGNLLELFPLQPALKQKAFMNNADLNGFLDYFVEGKCRGGCTECGYCRDLAARFVRFQDMQDE